MRDSILLYARALVWGQLPSIFYQWMGLTFLWAGIAYFVYESSTDPRGVTRRAAAAYVGHLDAQFKSMFRPPRGAYMAWMQLCGAIALVALGGFLNVNPLFYGALGALVVPPLMVRLSVARRRQQIDNQVHGFALALANALKTTASIGDALWVTLTSTSKPLKEELETALKQVRVGSTIEEALLAMAARTQSRSLDVVVSALLIGRQTGGDLPRILEQTASSLRELKRLEEHTEKTITGARQGFLISACITVGLVIMLPKVMPGFLDPLRDTVTGQIVAFNCALIFILAMYMGYRFTRTDI